MIYVLYGQPGSGKTTLGIKLAKHLDTPFIIDGDEFREMFANKNYGRAGREENIRNANAVATYLNKKGKDGKWKAVYIQDEPNSWKNEGDVVEVLLCTDRLLRKEYHVDDFEPGNPVCILDTNKGIGDVWSRLIKDLEL